MEVVVNFLNLSQVLVLHLSPRNALSAGLIWIWEQYLVNYDIVNVDFLLGQFDSKSLGLIHTKEFRYAHRYERRLRGIFKLAVNFFNLSFHAVY